MEKLVCESLQEYRLNEAEGDKHGMISGLVHAAKTYPGRLLRSARTRSIIQKYKIKLFRKINLIPPKYIPTLNKLIQKTQNRLENINPGDSEELQKNQKVDILDDMKDYMKGILDKLKGAMDNQLKVYDDALHQRLDRPGTITGVEFYPEEKTALLSEWQAVQDQITDYIQSKIVELMDNPFIKQYQEIKGELEEYIKSQDRWHSSYDDESSDPSKVTDRDQKQILDILEKSGFQPKTPYKVLDASNFQEPPTRGAFFEYSNDKNGNIFYWFVRPNAKGKYIVEPQSMQYFVRPGDSAGDWKKRIFGVQKGVQAPVKPATPTP